MGSHWYLYWVPGSSNMPIVLIFLDPIHQSRPEMGLICWNHNIIWKIVFFGSNRPSSIRKHSNWVWIGIGGQKYPFWGKKYIFELFGILKLWSCFGLLDPFFHKISPQIPPNDDYSCCGHPLVTLMRVWVIIYAINNHIIWIQFTKVSLKWSKFAKVIILCVKLIWIFGTNRPISIRRHQDWVWNGFCGSKIPFLEQEFPNKYPQMIQLLLKSW